MMKFVKQFLIILAVSFVGEVLNTLIPLPVPASIYGLVIMLVCLKTHIIPLESVKETGDFMIEIMPLMFIPAAVGLLDGWSIIEPHWLQFVVLAMVSTFLVIIVSGRVTQAVIRHDRRRAEK